MVLPFLHLLRKPCPSFQLNMARATSTPSRSARVLFATSGSQKSHAKKALPFVARLQKHSSSKQTPRQRIVKSCLVSPGKPDKRKSKVKKQVRFDSSSKTWDGPRVEHILLEQIVVDFWQRRGRVDVLNKLIEHGNSTMLSKLHSLLLDVIEREQKNPDSRGTALLPTGGKYAFRLRCCNVPHAKILLSKIYEAKRRLLLRTVLAQPVKWFLYRIVREQLIIYLICYYCSCQK